MGLFNRRPRNARNERRLPALTAAAPSRVHHAGGADKITDATKDWQNEAWRFYDTVGELRYVCQYLSNALTKCQLVASDVDEAGAPTGTTEDEVVRQIVADIAGGPAGQADLLGKMATHLTVPGEFYLVILVRDDGVNEPVEEWYVLSTSEVRRESTGTVTVTLPDNTHWDLNDETDSIHRVWNPHARMAHQADSSVRATLPVLREITRLDQWIEATAKSRVVSNGILAVPNEMKTPTFGTADSDAPELEKVLPGYDYDDFTYPVKQAGPEALTDAMIETMSTAIKDQSSAAATVPIVISAPGDMIGQIQHINLSTDFTDTVRHLRDDAIRRLSLSLNVPAEVLTGMGNANHWSAWQIDDAAVSMHIEPMLTVICDRLTDYVLRPLLEAHGIDPAAFTVWYDTSALTLKPNRTDDATAAFDKGLITRDAYRREMGFTDADDWDVTTPEGQRDFMMGLVMRDPALLPAFGAQLGLPEPTGGWESIRTNRYAPPAQPSTPPTPVDHEPPARKD